MPSGIMRSVSATTSPRVMAASAESTTATTALSASVVCALPEAGAAATEAAATRRAVKNCVMPRIWCEDSCWRDQILTYLRARAFPAAPGRRRATAGPRVVGEPVVDDRAVRSPEWQTSIGGDTDGLHARFGGTAVPGLLTDGSHEVAHALGPAPRLCWQRG